MRRYYQSIRVITILLFCVTIHSRFMLSDSLGCIFLRDDQSIRCQNTSLQDIGESLHILTMVVNNKPQIIDIDYCEGMRELSPIFRRINASIDTVRIRRSNLRSIHMDAFAKLANTLKDLDLSHNFLSTIPEALSILWALEHLNLQHNRIVFVRPGSIFDGLINLREINLANNYIGLADERIDNLTQQNGYQLKASLGLADFNIGRAVRSLESLTLTGNRLVAAPVQIFTASWPELRHLDLSENVVGSLDRILHHFLPKLEFMDFHSNRIQTIKMHSLPVTLRYLDITENPLICNCEARWLYEWQKINTTTMRMPICNAPEALKGRELHDVPWAVMCPENGPSFQFNYSHNGSDYRDYDVIQLVSSTTEVTVSWKARHNDDKRKWTVVYRKADDSPYQMTLINPSLRNGKSENLGAETVFTENIQDLQPSTAYVICIAVIRDEKYTLEPGKCREVKTKTFGELEGELHPNDKKAKLKDMVKTHLEDLSVVAKAVTIRWRLMASTDHTMEPSVSIRHEWTIRIRRTGSDNYTDIPVYDITSMEDVNEQMYEYSVQDLAPRTHYDVCLVDVDHRVLNTEGEPQKEDTVYQTQTDGNTNNSMICRTIVTFGAYTLYAAEIVAIAAACAICVVVIGVTIYLCRQKKLLRCRKPQKFKEWVVKCLGNDERPQPIGCSIKYPTATIPRVKCESKSDSTIPNTARIGTWNTLRMPYKEFPQVDYSDESNPASTGYKEALSSVTIYSSGHSEC